MEISWSRAYQGRVYHGFTGEIADAGERTLCGKYFPYRYDAWDYVYNVPFKYKKCKKCLARLEAENG